MCLNDLLYPELSQTRVHHPPPRSHYRAPLVRAGLIPGSACPGARLSKYHDPELGARLSFASVADSCRSFGAGAVPAFLTRSALARFSARTRALA